MPEPDRNTDYYISPGFPKSALTFTKDEEQHGEILTPLQPGGQLDTKDEQASSVNKLVGTNGTVTGRGLRLEEICQQSLTTIKADPSHQPPLKTY